MRSRRGLVGLAVAVFLLTAFGYGFLAGLTGSWRLDGAAVAQTAGTVPGNALGATSDSEFWRAVRRGTQGTVSIQDKKAGIMVQSAGESWRAIRNGPLSLWGAWAMLGVIAVLAIYFAVRGRIKIDSGFSGRTMERFNSTERFAHWLLAVSFIVLGLSGLNMMYGRYVIKPIIGPEAFSMLAMAGKYVHNYVAFAFMVALVMVLVLWIRNNIPDKTDWAWLAKGGGLFSKKSHPPARKFNAGQKILFWLVLIGGISISLTGLALMFPFKFSLFAWTFAVLNVFGAGLPELTSIHEMQLSQLWHAFMSLAMIGLIIGHIYLGTIGMEGAFDAMGTGMVDQNWAREHHSLWAGEAKAAPPPAPAPEPKPEAGDD